MNERPVDNLTLRELLRDAELSRRELGEHLERGFAPKAASLARLIRPKPGGDWNHGLEDRSLHHTAQMVLDSHQFTDNLIQGFRRLLKAIDESVSRVSTFG
ncbi:MAG: hypothetical protein ACE5KM_11095 [Planctomycetaceae bacterium]